MPQTNRAVELVNKNGKMILKKMKDIYKDWHKILPFALWGYKTSVRTSTGATPYSLVYGMEAVLPVEVEIPLLYILLGCEISKFDWLCERYEDLALLDDKRLYALNRVKGYQMRITHAFNRKVRPWKLVMSQELAEGDTKGTLGVYEGEEGMAYC